MKTKAQKQADLKEAKTRLDASKTLLFASFSRMSAEDLRKLRREMSASGATFSVVKKRLLNVLFKQEGIDYDARAFEGSVGTIFASGGLDTVTGPLYRFLTGLGADKKARDEHAARILGAYDLEAKASVARETVMRIGTLPSREVLLGQLLGTLAGPIRSFLYLLSEKSSRSQS